MNSEIICVLDKNTKIDIDAEIANSDWIKVNFREKNGYIHKDYVQKISQETICKLSIVTTDELNFRAGPSTSSEKLDVFSKGTVVGTLEICGDWAKVRHNNKVGYLYRKYISVRDEVLSRSDLFFSNKNYRVLKLAERYLGVKYTWGGNTPKTGFDCSGLIYYICRNYLGYQVNRVAAEQYKQGKYIPKESLMPGDLVFFLDKKLKSIDHVGIYSGNGHFIHAPQTGEVIRYGTLARYGNRYYGAKRLFE